MCSLWVQQFFTWPEGPAKDYQIFGKCLVSYENLAPATSIVHVVYWDKAILTNGYRELHAVGCFITLQPYAPTKLIPALSAIHHLGLLNLPLHPCFVIFKDILGSCGLQPFCLAKYHLLALWDSQISFTALNAKQRLKSHKLRCSAQVARHSRWLHFLNSATVSDIVISCVIFQNYY